MSLYFRIIQRVEQGYCRLLRCQVRMNVSLRYCGAAVSGWLLGSESIAPAIAQPRAERVSRAVHRLVTALAREHILTLAVLQGRGHRGRRTFSQQPH